MRPLQFGPLPHDHDRDPDPEDYDRADDREWVRITGVPLPYRNTTEPIPVDEIAEGYFGDYDQDID